MDVKCWYIFESTHTGNRTLGEWPGTVTVLWIYSSSCNHSSELETLRREVPDGEWGPRHWAGLVLPEREAPLWQRSWFKSYDLQSLQKSTKVWLTMPKTLALSVFSIDALKDNLDHATSFQNRSYISPDRTTVKIGHLLVNIGPSRIHCSISTPSKLTSTRWYGLGRYLHILFFEK